MFRLKYHLTDKEKSSFARTLRKNMTKEERHLWFDFFKANAIPAKRQQIIGPYIADFYIPSEKLVIELDGSEHFEKAQQKYDEVRTQYMAKQGLMVLRYSNRDIAERFEAVCADILQHIN